MKHFLILALTLYLNQPSTKIYRFAGKFKSASVVEGSGSFTFIGLNGEEKEFGYDMTWGQKFPYDFFDELANTNLNHVGKWFVITYHGKYGNLVGDDSDSKRWYRKIDSIKMIAIPKSQDRLITMLCTLEDIDIKSTVIEFLNGNGEGVFITYASASLKDLPADFIKHAADGQYDNHEFEIQYRIEYELESTTSVVNKLYTIKMK